MNTLIQKSGYLFFNTKLESYVYCQILDFIYHIFSFVICYLFIVSPLPPFLSNSQTLSNSKYCFRTTLVCFFNSLPNAEHSNTLIVAAFSKSFFSGKISSTVKNSYLLIFPDDKANILAVFLSKLY